MSLNEKLDAYAKLLVTKGLALQQGRDVMVYAGLDQPEFVEKVVEECYRQGARKVWVQWSHQPVDRIDQLYCSEATLARLEDWQVSKLAWRRDTLPSMLYLVSEDPDGLQGIDQAKRARARMSQFPVIKPFLDAMENRYPWCIAAVPGKAWAQKVFPGEPPARAVRKLWDAILLASRALGDPVANWTRHNTEIKARCAKLNAFRFDALEYRDARGTDLTVGLLPNVLFLGGSETDLSGRVFEPNIPSEEVFTSPAKGRAEGWAVASKPLSYQGELIENFAFRFENGKVVEIRAGKGRELLEKMIGMDEGAAYLGECALIPCDSPINNTGILFYETLFDENAACHLALGRGFTNCVEGFETYSPEALKSVGINESMIHVDFMIGNETLDITGITKDGRRIPIFRGGEWAEEG